MELKVEKREVLGKKVKALRRMGIIPAELYGREVENLHLSVDVKKFDEVYSEAGENTVVNVLVDGATKPVLIHSVQRNYLTDEIESVDFYEVKMDEKIEANVPIEFVGESPAVKDLDGILIKAMDEVNVEALPADIPSEITIDLSQLKSLGESIYVKDLPVTEKYKFMVDLETVVVTVSEPKAEEEVAEEITPEDVVVEGEEEKKAEEKASEETSGKDEA